MTGAQTPFAHAVGQEHTVQSHQRAHGDVDAAGEHDAGQAAGHTDKAGVGAEQIEERLKIGKASAAIYHAARGIQDDKENDGDQKQQGIAVDALTSFQCGSGFHTPTASFRAAAFAALRFLNQALTGGA